MTISDMAALAGLIDPGAPEAGYYKTVDCGYGEFYLARRSVAHLHHPRRSDGVGSSVDRRCNSSTVPSWRISCPRKLPRQVDTAKVDSAGAGRWSQNETIRN